MYYLIETEYVGPNRKDSHGHWIGDSRTMQICTEPGKTNMSHEVITDGWLGTTNDMSAWGRGEFETLDQAREAAHGMGFTEPAEMDEYDEYEDIVEIWISKEASREQWDAGDWFDGVGRSGTCEEYGITAQTTDEELAVMVDRAEDEARGENAELHGCLGYFEELRQELRDQLED